MPIYNNWKLYVPFIWDLLYMSHCNLRTICSANFKYYTIVFILVLRSIHLQQNGKLQFKYKSSVFLNADESMLALMEYRFIQATKKTLKKTFTNEVDRNRKLKVKRRQRNTQNTWMNWKVHRKGERVLYFIIFYQNFDEVVFMVSPE